MRAPADYLAGRVEAGDIPGASWIVGDAEGVIAGGVAGDAALVPTKVAARSDTLYDLASLTKPLVTSLLTLILGRETEIEPGDPVSRFLPELDRLDKRDISLGHLLTHTSGLPDWAPLYLKGASIQEYLRQIGEMPPRTRPGTRVLYSDLGYIALGAVLERVGSATLERLAEAFIFEPLGVRPCFRPGKALGLRVAATEESCNYERMKAGPAGATYRGWREGIIRGEVHDQNAFAAGGVAGHAGLFGTAGDVYQIARQALVPEGGLLRRSELPLIAEPGTDAEGEARSFAYRINRGRDGGADPATAAGDALPPVAFGHNGFTGTSVWIDPGARRVFVLLTNRVHPRVREEFDMNVLRREFHRLAASA
jgi:serine-type D-Ala-D-Ala carboxypeptidase